MTQLLAAQLSGPIDYAKRQLAGAGAGDAPPAVTPDPADQELPAELAAAARAWRESAEGQAFLATHPGMSVEQVRAELAAAVTGPHFAEARKFSLKGLLPKAISLGVAGQVELGIGVYGSIGYIHDLSLELSGGGFYLLLAAAEGVEGDVDVGVQVGIWKKATADVSGKYKGAELTFDEGLGLSGFVLAEDDDTQAWLLELEGGLGDGASGLEFHMRAQSHGSSGAVSQTPASNMLILDKLECLKTSESGHDEVYLTFQIDGAQTFYRYPTWNYYAMKPGTDEAVWNLGRSVWFEDTVDVTVYDQDSSRDPDKSDVIAAFKLQPKQFAGVGPGNAQSWTVGDSGASYKLTAYLLDLTA